MWRNLKGYFLTGLLVLVPILVTFFLLYQALNQIDQLLPYRVLGIPQIPGLGIIFIVLLIILTGLATRNYVGRKLFTWGEQLVSKIPIISRIYEGIKQIIQTFFSDNGELFKKVVLIEYPRKGIYSIAFFTQDTRGLVQEAIEDDVVSVFLPTTPNPTSGFLLFVPKKDVRELHMSIEEAMKLVVSGGAIVPKISSPPRRKKIITVDQQPAMEFMKN